MRELTYIKTQALNKVIIKDSAHKKSFIASQENKKIIPHNRIIFLQQSPLSIQGNAENAQLKNVHSPINQRKAHQRRREIKL